MPKDTGHTVKQNPDVLWYSWGKRGNKRFNIRPRKIFFFPFSWFCQKNTKHSDLNLKKSHKNLFLAEVNDQWGQDQLIGSDVITIGFPNNPQIHKDVYKSTSAGSGGIKLKNITQIPPPGIPPFTSTLPNTFPPPLHTPSWPQHLNLHQI